MPRSPEQFDKIRKQKKQLILDTALELFAEKGFHATSMSQVAKQAKVSKGLAYNYFASKQEILSEIVKEGFDSIYSNFDLNHDGILTRDEFEQFIRKSFHVISENRRFWKLYSAIVMQSNLTDSLMDEYGDKFPKIMQMLNRFTTSMGSKDPEGDLLVISSLVKGALLIVISAPDFFSLKQLEDKTIEACFRLIST
ncbi:transcriptional regulator, TetR family [Mariniphaga anaerophila]|uniref:Transcriptional regulator, TetR family n=1 Tax=Mariniphaga anaerophila TaxID=1484053 RepID=A0A1M4W478_9BACT|nr:TetR/AcrR family transcriptional regulator [Mariniphaga anaerophila]SHE76026.1 transcriptional regulator, TetR family [Mariniphaga anaerophila]